MQNLSLIASLVLEYDVTKFFSEGEQLIHKIWIKAPESGFNFKKLVFCPESFFLAQNWAYANLYL